MMSIAFQYPPGSTPLDPDEVAGLKLPYISTQAELNTAEQNNLLQGRAWAEKVKKDDLLSDIFIRKLHSRMFKDVWNWAGKYRKSDKSIGVDWKQISGSILQLCGDAQFWIENNTFAWDEIGCRFHHRLVQIHPFSNGNGRHARLMTDLLFLKYGISQFTWGAATHDGPLDKASNSREKYIDALRTADRRDFSKLLEFVRS